MLATPNHLVGARSGRQCREPIARDPITGERSHRVVMTANGREALEALAKDRFRLVLMDVQMPEMDGLQATVALREKEKEKGERVPPACYRPNRLRHERRSGAMPSGRDGRLPHQADRAAGARRDPR